MPCSAVGSPAAKSPPETAGGGDQDRQVEEETMAGLTEGVTAHPGLPPPSNTPSPPTRLGCASRQETAVGIPLAPVTEQPMRRAEAAAAAVEGGSVAAATATVGAAENVAAAAETPEAVAAAATAVEDGAAVAAEIAAETVTAPGLAGGTAAVFGGGSTSLSANHQGAQPQTQELGQAVDQEQTEVVALSASPAPVTAAVLAAAVTAATAAGSMADAPVEGGVPVAAVSAGTSAAAEGADTQERDQAASGRRDHGTDAPGRAARGKSVRKFRAQPAPRRPGAGLGPGAPGPLRGWRSVWRDRQTHRGSRREERHRPDGGGGTSRAGSGKERRLGGPEAEDAGQEVEEGAGAQSSAEGRRL
ncbi:unnamed protein product [Closterium sp. Naga37s-1]|nr:unnamed protein product [Closterium sp. Naga37s-1]